MRIWPARHVGRQHDFRDGAFDAAGASERDRLAGLSNVAFEAVRSLDETLTLEIVSPPAMISDASASKSSVSPGYLSKKSALSAMSIPSEFEASRASDRPCGRDLLAREADDPLRRRPDGLPPAPRWPPS
jgi:hypothetical protein